MRGLGIAGVGLGAMLGGSGWADEPAARFGVPAGELTVRGQAPTQPPPSTILGPARPLPQGPSVYEQRSVPQPGVSPPAATFGTPVPIGVPNAYGGPVGSYLGTPPPTYGVPVGSYVGPPPVVGEPPAVGTVAVPTNIDSPLIGDGPARPTGPFGFLTGGQGFAGPQRLHLDADFLLWFVKSGNAPPLVTTSSPSSAGILSAADTQVLYGGGSLDHTLHTGGRFSGVYWLDDANRWGVDGSLFFLARRGYGQTFTTDGYPLLARPFDNVNQGIPFSEVVASPGLATGSVTVAGDTSMWGADVNARRHLCGGCTYRLDGLVGFRYLNLSETLSVTEGFLRDPNAPTDVGISNALAGTINDTFRTENHFYGVNVGLAGEVRRGKWYAEGRASVALGTVFQSVIANGSQQIVFPTGTAVYQGGLLAVPGNLGTFNQRKFGVVPEVGLKLGYHLTDRWRVNVGYNFLYLNSVVRPGDQIDTGLDVTRIPNFPLPGTVPAAASPRPLPPLRTTGVFVQGISFGVSWAF